MKKIVFVLAASILFFACKKNEVKESTSRFMILHASPNTPDVDFLIDNKAIILQPLRYTSNIYYRDILSGIRNFKVIVSGRTVIDTNMNFEQGDVRSIILYDEPLNFKMQVVDDELISIGGGGTRVRFFQLIPDASPLALFNSIDNSEIFSSTDFGNNQNWKSIPSGVYNWQLKNTNTQTSIYTDWRPDTLEAGKNYTIISNGLQTTMTADTLGVWLISNGEN